MRSIQRNDGFTLMEVLIATVIFAIISLGAVASMVSVMQGNAFSNKITTATTLAQTKLEEIKRLGYTNADNAAGTEDYKTITNYSAYKRVTSVVPGPVSAMKTVTVTVYWKADKRSVPVQTILAQ